MAILNIYPFQKLTMKKLLIATFIATAFLSASASAQRPGGGRQAFSKQTLMDSLKISETTADSVIAIRSASMVQLRTIMSDESLSQDEKREKAKPVAQDTKEKLKKYLSEEQIEKIRQMEMDRRKGMMNRADQ